MVARIGWNVFNYAVTRPYREDTGPGAISHNCTSKTIPGCFLMVVRILNPFSVLFWASYAHKSSTYQVHEVFEQLLQRCAYQSNTIY